MNRKLVFLLTGFLAISSASVGLPSYQALAAETDAKEVEAVAETDETTEAAPETDETAEETSSPEQTAEETSAPA